MNARTINPHLLKRTGALWFALGVFMPASGVGAATLTMQTNALGPTPEVLAYNCAHFFPGSNTRDWWRYSGVSGVRIFISSASIEPSDDLSPVGDNVTDQASFELRRANLRANQVTNSGFVDTAYIKWSYFSNRYETVDLGSSGGNRLKVNYALGEMRKLGIDIMAQITVSISSLPIASSNDWAGKWELWQHYYAQSFYLGRHFDVERYQMYNEPDLVGVPDDQFLWRLQLAADAMQAALADVNTLFGKSLAPSMRAPVNAGAADSDYVGGLGGLAVTNRHVNYLGVSNVNYLNLHKYDYHEYDHTPFVYGTNLVALHAQLAAGMSPEPRFETTISEFNTHTGGNFDGLTRTMDSPTEYPLFGGICVSLMSNLCSELYAFKFGQTLNTSTTATNYPVQKNAMHYLDNDNAPFQTGGITKAGEVYRLFNRAFAPGRNRLNTLKGPGAGGLEVHASHDAVRNRYHVYSVNTDPTNLSLTVDFSAWNIPTNNQVLIEKVSEAIYGGVKLWTNLAGGMSVGGTQSSNSVWLLTIPKAAQQAVTNVVASEDAEVRDGANKGVQYGTSTFMTARNDPTTTSNRSAAFIKFVLPGISLSNLEFAVLSVQASTISTNATAQAHVYALTNTAWSQAAIVWSNAPNLRDDAPAGVKITNSIVEGQGTSAFIVGQIVASSTNAAEKLIDVTDYIRGQTNQTLTFLVSQDPRWDVTLPSLAVGDTQPDGIRMVSKEGGDGPVLRLVYREAITNQPPVAVDDTAATIRNVPVVINVLSNDSDADGGTLSIQSFTQGVHGGVSNSGSGTLTYTPNTGYVGSDGFSYTIIDGQGGTNSAAVTVTVYWPGSQPVWTNLLVGVEANIRGGASGAVDVDENTQGYLMVKSNAPPFDAARKAYFQFDLTGLNLDLNTQAVFTVKTHTTTFTHRAQLWGLSNAYPGFNSSIVWNSAQANETNSNNLLTSGALTAGPIGSPVLFSTAASTAYYFTIPRLGDFVLSNQITLVLSGAGDAANDVGGLRLARTNATLQALVTASTPAAATNIAISLNPDGNVTLRFAGTPNQDYLVQAATNLPTTNWLTLGTNAAGTNGLWSSTDTQATNFQRRLYRSLLP